MVAINIIFNQMWSAGVNFPAGEHACESGSNMYSRRIVHCANHSTEISFSFDLRLFSSVFSALLRRRGELAAKERAERGRGALQSRQGPDGGHDLLLPPAQQTVRERGLGNIYKKYQ